MSQKPQSKFWERVSFATRSYVRREGGVNVEEAGSDAPGKVKTEFTRGQSEWATRLAAVILANSQPDERGTRLPAGKSIEMNQSPGTITADAIQRSRKTT